MVIFHCRDLARRQKVNTFVATSLKDMEQNETDWSDVRALSIEGTSIMLITGDREVVVDCGSASQLAETLRFWSRNDSGLVVFPEPATVKVRARADVGI
jgi:hypothetical protein